MPITMTLNQFDSHYWRRRCWLGVFFESQLQHSNCMWLQLICFESEFILIIQTMINKQKKRKEEISMLVHQKRCFASPGMNSIRTYAYIKVLCVQFWLEFLLFSDWMSTQKAKFFFPFLSFCYGFLFLFLSFFTFFVFFFSFPTHLDLLTSWHLPSIIYFFSLSVLFLSCYSSSTTYLYTFSLLLGPYKFLQS